MHTHPFENKEGDDGEEGGGEDEAHDQGSVRRGRVSIVRSVALKFANVNVRSLLKGKKSSWLLEMRINLN